MVRHNAAIYLHCSYRILLFVVAHHLLLPSTSTQNRLNRTQKQQVQQFRQVTGAPDDLALDLLRRTSWNLETAVDNFFAAGFSAKASRGRPPVDTSTLEALFDQYKGTWHTW